jgi:hypothetical protein
MLFFCFFHILYFSGVGSVPSSAIITAVRKSNTIQWKEKSTYNRSEFLARTGKMVLKFGAPFLILFSDAEPTAENEMLQVEEMQVFNFKLAFLKITISFHCNR